MGWIFFALSILLWIRGSMYKNDAQKAQMALLQSRVNLNSADTWTRTTINNTPAICPNCKRP